MRKTIMLIMCAMLLFSGCNGASNNKSNEDGQVKVVVKDPYGNYAKDFSIYKWTPGQEKRLALYSSVGTDENGVARYSNLEAGKDYLIFYKGPSHISEEDLDFSLADGSQFKKVHVTSHPQTIYFNVKKDLWEKQKELDARLAAEQKARQEELENANVILTIKDASGKILKNKYVYFGSKSMLKESRESDGDKRYKRSEYTDENGVVKLFLEPGEYVIGLDNVQSYHLMDYQNIPLDGRYVIEEFSDRLEKEIQFGDTSELESIQNKLEQQEKSEEQEEEAKEMQEKLQKREEYCSPTHEYAVTRCCAQDFYRVEGDQEILTRQGLETVAPDNVYGHEIEIGSLIRERKEIHRIFVDGNLVGNRTQDMHSYGNLLIEVVSCSHPEAGWPTCCLKIQSIDKNQQAFALGEQKSGLTLKDENTMQHEDNNYVLDQAFVIDDKVYYRNRSITDYKGKETIGVVMQTMQLSSKDYFMRESDEKVFGNHTLTLVDVLDEKVKVTVEFNQTFEDAIVDNVQQVNGLLLSTRETFKNSAVISVG